jgi:hypothetical protein
VLRGGTQPSNSMQIHTWLWSRSRHGSLPHLFYHLPNVINPHSLSHPPIALFFTSFVLSSNASLGTFFPSIHSDSKGLVIFGACAVVAVAVVVIEEWPTIKETYQEVRARRRRRLIVCAHEHHLPISEEEQPMAASGINEPVQEMTMRSRNIVRS